ncbi:hypothetical protein [Sphingomonas sp. DBB INV C78]|uniref:hypothetical protein n=1 Tax=Sphingomonas sp. DBB INV C78 TaxID=3349434 RepID=UPI0036D3AD17
MTETTAVTPIVCMLDRSGFKERMAWIADLNMRALRMSRRDDLRLELDYAADAIADVRQMIAQEQACCGFLTFDLTQRSDALIIAITAPEAARDAAEIVFGPFQEKTPQSAVCGCTGGCGA